tara:strand:- start:1124 stop:1261 length:138 start_codon:yes stop_codon:yes gene_type:complete
MLIELSIITGILFLIYSLKVKVGFIKNRDKINKKILLDKMRMHFI